MRTILLSLLSIVFAAGMISCDDDDDDDMDTEPEIIFEQTFDENADSWITDETSGEFGWCGDIAHYETDEGQVSASAGTGYAGATFGACNDYWTNAGVPGSGPFGPFGEYNDEAGYDNGTGFTKELDIYIDPSWSAPDTSVFTYAVSFDLLDSIYPNNFRYFFIPTSKPGSQMYVMSTPINEAGWYTFRFIFGNNNGNVSANFELEYNNSVLMTQTMNSTGITGEQVSSFEVDKVGTGYAWFAGIMPGLEVPVDEQRLWQ